METSLVKSLRILLIVSLLFAFGPPLLLLTTQSKTCLTTKYGVHTNLWAQEQVGEVDQNPQLTIQDLIDRFDMYLEEIGIREGGNAFTYTTIGFYLSLGFLIVFVVIEIFVKIIKRLMKIPHREHPVKRVTRHFFVLTVIAKSLMLIMGAIIILTHAQATSTFFQTYILNPTNLSDLFLRDKYFLIILCILILYNFGSRALFSSSEE